MHFPRRSIPESELYQRKQQLDTPAGGYGYGRFKSQLSLPKLKVGCTFIPCGNIFDRNRTGVPKVLMHFPRRSILKTLDTPAGGYGYVRFKSLLYPPKMEVECTCMSCGNVFVLDSSLFLGETSYKRIKQKKKGSTQCLRLGVQIIVLSVFPL
jgi:hypothetical protein